METNNEILTPMQVKELVKPDDSAAFNSEHELFERLLEYVEVDHDGMIVLSEAYYDSNIEMLFTMIRDDDSDEVVVVYLVNIPLITLSEHLKLNIDIQETVLLNDKADYNELIKHIPEEL